MGLLVESSSDLREVPGTKSSPSVDTLRLPGLRDLAGPWFCLCLSGWGAWVRLALVMECSGSSAPRPESAKMTLGAESPLFIDRPDFFDYPDSDQARLLALAQFIGEKPVIFVNSDSSSRFFHHILVSTLVVAFFFLLFQFCAHMSFQKGAERARQVPWMPR